MRQIDCLHYHTHMTQALATSPDGRLVRTCSIWRALEAVGDTASLLILEASWLGIRRFDAICTHTGLQRALASDRLKRLVETGILAKQAYCEHPPRFEYVMSEKGRSLFGVALMMLRWEKRWGRTEAKISVRLTHQTCGQEFTPVAACGRCNAPYRASQVRWQEGPGVGWMRPLASRRRQRRDQSRDAPTVLFDTIAGVTGDRWSSLILRSVFMGFHRFEEIRQDTLMASNILTDRLDWLEKTGMLERRRPEESGRRETYHLARPGLDYLSVLLTLMVWGDRWYASPEGPPIVIEHTECGAPLEPIVACSACGGRVHAGEVDFVMDLPDETLLS